MGAGIQVNVSLDADPARVERILLEIGQAAANELPGMLAEPAPSVSFDPGVGDSSLGLSLNYQVADFASQFAVRNELRRRVFLRLREEGIEFPYPTRTVYVRGAGAE